jgi:hypothetical protein
METHKLYNPQYSNLSPEERQSLLRSLPELDGRFTFVKSERFEKFGLTTDTAIYTYAGKEFVFVPGGTVTLGWDKFAVGMDDATMNEIMAEYDDAFELDVFLRESMSPVRTATIVPMLVERSLNDIGWRNVGLDSPELEPFQENIKKYFHSKLSELTIHRTMRIFRDYKNGEARAQMYEPVSLDDFLRKLHDEHFSLPTEDEWEYLCGGGSRTLFRWGDSFDYEMKLDYFAADFLPPDAPYTLKEPNQFGLSIAYDPYKYEVVENSEYFLKGGDGGCNICGGSGIVLGYLPVATYFRSVSLTNDELGDQDEIGGDYTFYRRIVRL